MTGRKVELLFFDGCPGHDALLPRLRDLLADAGLDPAVIELRRIETQEDAERERFLGSPTLRIDGRDVEPDADERTDYGLKCRIYRDAGRQTGTPPEAWIREVLGLSG